ncbi:MAG: hypothetical protein E4H08_10000 [Candidatus Atribacteria bacterium]|nr:MAG: hypothetical protein E4H08_10000 [Candidatus Atribacteria bacterium]
MKNTHLMNISELRETLAGRPYVHVIVASSEDRSIASIGALRRLGCSPDHLFVFTYPRFQDRSVSMGGVTKHERIVSLMSREKLHEEPVPNAHAFSLLHKGLVSIQDRAKGLPIVVDFTCMTEVHLLALVSIATRNASSQAPLFVCYTTPQYYSFEEPGFSGWKDVLFVPIGSLSSIALDGHSHGLILAGHDGERLAVALQESEPETGKILYTQPETRPDFLHKAREANQVVVKRLLSLRNSDSRDTLRAWKEERTMLDDLEHVLAISKALASEARRSGGSLILFPFGPKLVTLAAALAIKEEGDLASWAVCPIPTRLRPDFTFGSGHTYCLELR